MNDIQVYLVGGAVRDKLLGYPISEQDYVVVGATAKDMQNLGFTQVGADFPVFLHPKTHDEYALARTERKTGKGYLGFDVHTSPTISLEQDLMRRDLTINAMAIQVHGLLDNRPITGDIIDPYGGQLDLQKRILRHVSQAFDEDPVRVLRLARFASRYAPFGFTIADETKNLVLQMKKAGELNHLVAERIWAESKKALSQTHSALYFDNLHLLGVLDIVLPEFAKAYHKANASKLWQIIQIALHNNQDELQVKFAILSLVFANWHHQSADKQAFLSFCHHQKIPKDYQQTALFVLGNYAHLLDFQHLKSQQIFELFKASSALKNSTLFMRSLHACNHFALAKNQIDAQDLIQQLQSISAGNVNQNLQGRAIGEAIDKLRLNKLKQLIQDKL